MRRIQHKDNKPAYCKKPKDETVEYTSPPKRSKAIVENPKPSKYVKKYAGVYVFEYTEYPEYSTEQWILSPDGTCTWVDESGGYRTQKYGHWTAEQGIIHTSVKGRSGDDIEEDYKFKKGFFRSFNHYLKKTKDL